MMYSYLLLASLLALFVPALMVTSKDALTMAHAHSAECRAESGASAAEEASFFAGTLADSPAARRHVYCVYRRCKLVGKDGKIRKTDKMTQDANGKTALKMLNKCLERVGGGGNAPEDLVWRLYRCGPGADVSHKLGYPFLFD